MHRSRGQTELVEKATPCRSCGMDIAFSKSKRTGKWYPTNVLVDSSYPKDKCLVTSPLWFHKCPTSTPTPTTGNLS